MTTRTIRLSVAWHQRLISDLQNDYARWPWPAPPTSPRSRQRIYAAAFDADLRRLRTAHGASAIDAALKLIEQRSGRGERDQWDTKRRREP
jgi:hypothetical protein